MTIILTAVKNSHRAYGRIGQC